MPCKRVITPSGALVHGHRFSDGPFGAGFGPGPRRGRGRGPGGRGRNPEAAPPVERAEVAGWFAGRLPDDWFTGPVDLTIDRDEITVVGTLAEPAAGGAVCGEERELFTTLSVPVMTRLRQRERLVVDTLVDAGVARSRSEALAWAVRLVGQHADAWLTELRAAMASVEASGGAVPRCSRPGG